MIANDDVANEELFENFTKLEKEPNKRDIDFIINSLKENCFFTNLKDTEFEVMIPNMFFAKIKKNDYIFKQHDKA